MEVDFFPPRKMVKVRNGVEWAVCKFVVDEVNKLGFMGGSSRMFKSCEIGGEVGLLAWIGCKDDGVWYMHGLNIYLSLLEEPR